MSHYNEINVKKLYIACQSLEDYINQQVENMGIGGGDYTLVLGQMSNYLKTFASVLLSADPNNQGGILLDSLAEDFATEAAKIEGTTYSELKTNINTIQTTLGTLTNKIANTSTKIYYKHSRPFIILDDVNVEIKIDEDGRTYVRNKNNDCKYLHSFASCIDPVGGATFQFPEINTINFINVGNDNVNANNKKFDLLIVGTDKPSVSDTLYYSYKIDINYHASSQIYMVKIDKV